MRPQVGELVVFTTATTETTGDARGSCDGFAARLPLVEQIRDEPTDRLHVVVIAATEGELVVSRRSPQVIAELFRARFADIATDLIGIHHVVREPGVRAKIALDTALDDLDFIQNRLCPGDGAIVRQIVVDSGDPAIDMVPVEPELSQYVCAAMVPTEVTLVAIEEGDDRIFLVLPDEEAASLDPIHAQLAADLVGRPFEILRVSDHERADFDAVPVATFTPRAPAPRR